MKLFHHQKTIIDADPKKCGLWLGTGGGKTRIALALARGSTLVICPKTQAEDRNWQRELVKMDKRLVIHVISKETFRRDWETLPAFNTVIVDEAETCLGVTPNTRQRNKQTIPKASQLFEALQSFLQKYPPERIYLCTATITRSPFTVWAAGVLLGKSWDYYKWRSFFYTRLPMPGREVWTPKSSNECKNKLAECVRSIGSVGRLEDWFDVPEQTYRTDWVDLTDEQKKRIKEIKIEYPDPIVALGKRLQIENGCLNGDEYNASELISSAKSDRILRYAEEFPRLIIWAKFTNQINHYDEILTHAGYTVYRLTGETKDREALFKTLSTATNAILIAQASISAGWEWKACPTMIFASRTYNISDYIQGQGRIQRTDAIKKNLYINLITRGGIDEAVNDAIENKRDFSERVYLNL
jgi:SNF2 family DNA or RNA helicase